MTNDPHPLDEAERDAKHVADRASKAVKDGVDAIDDLRNDPTVTDAAHTMGRRVRELSSEQPAVFAAAIAATALVVGVIVGRVLR